MAITNAEIIETAKQHLHAEGILKATGRYFTAKVNGEEAIAAFEIWKYAENKKNRKSDPNEEDKKGYCFLKLSHFFKSSQVKKI